jgi:hypothetical protein
MVEAFFPRQKNITEINTVRVRDKLFITFDLVYPVLKGPDVLSVW